MLAAQMAEFLKEYDMYLPADANADIQLHASTGHPCAVVPYKFAPHSSGRGGRGAGADTTAPVTYNAQPICGVIAGNLYNDDKILSVAHQLQINPDWHKHRPSL